MSPELSDKYLLVRFCARGKNLRASTTNPGLKQIRRNLENFSFEEKKADGALFKFSVQDVDEFNSQLLNPNLLNCSSKVKLNIYDSYPHSQNNYFHQIQSKIAKELMRIKANNGREKGDEVLVKMEEILPQGGFKGDRWPSEKISMISF